MNGLSFVLKIYLLDFRFAFVLGIVERLSNFDLDF